MARYTASASEGLQGRPILLRHQLAYGGGNLLGSGALAISGAWLLYFYTTFCGLTLIEASFIFSVASIIDAISNPLMGYLTDNFGKTRLGKRFGRRRFFLLIGIPLMMFYPLLWVEGLSFWYYLSTYVVFEIIYTSIMVPYETLATEMTDDFSLRSKLTGYKAIFGKLANFLAAFIPGQFILLYGKDSATPFFLTGLTYGAILIVAISCLWLCSWERERGEEVETSAKKRTAEHPAVAGERYAFDFLSTRIPQASWYVPVRLWRGMAVCLHLHLFRDLRSTTRSSDGGRAEQPELDSAADLYGAVYRPVREKGLQQTLYPRRWGSSFSRFCCIPRCGFSIYRPASATVLMFGITVLFGLGYRRGLLYTLGPFTPSPADVDEIYTGRRREGIYAGAMTFSGKILRSIVVFSMGAILSFYGFQSKAHSQPESAVTAIAVVFCVGVIALALGRHRLQQADEAGPEGPSGGAAGSRADKSGRQN